jgi:hypothetical protein
MTLTAAIVATTDADTIVTTGCPGWGAN